MNPINLLPGRRTCILWLAVTLVSVGPGAVVVKAVSSTSASTVQTTKRAGSQSGVELMREAYATLAQADHDYKGHRKAAMQQIEEAARKLGVKLGGGEKKHEGQKLVAAENQSTSDTQLQAAQAKLESARAEFAGKAHHRILRHLNEAITQLSTALKIR